MIDYDRISEEEFETIPEDTYQGRSLYEAESYNGNILHIYVKLKTYDELEKNFLHQYEWRKFKVYDQNNKTNGIKFPDLVICTFNERYPNMLTTEKDAIRQIANEYWKEYNEETHYVSKKY